MQGQLPYIEICFRTYKIYLAMTGDDYAHILSELTDDENVDAASIRVLERFQSAFQALVDAELTADPFFSETNLSHIE